MARDNYSYKKYQKELAKKKKAEEKKQRKLEKKTTEVQSHLALSDGKCAPSLGESGQVPNDQVALE
ncbi:MAG: hypothetical protein V1884_03805 [Candidatus Omnitrophota bacterium]